MASNPTSTEAPAPAKGTPWLLITLIALLFIIAAGAAVGGTWLYMSGQPGDAAAADSEPAAPPPEPVFVEIEPFTVNLQDDQGRILYVGIALKVAGEPAAQNIESHMPQIRNRILMTLTSQQAAALTSVEGKTALAGEIRASVSEPFTEAGEPVAVSDVLFTNFIVQ